MSCLRHESSAAGRQTFVVVTMSMCFVLNVMQSLGFLAEQSQWLRKFNNALRPPKLVCAMKLRLLTKCQEFDLHCDDCFKVYRVRIPIRSMKDNTAHCKVCKSGEVECENMTIVWRKTKKHMQWLHPLVELNDIGSCGVCCAKAVKWCDCMNPGHSFARYTLCSDCRCPEAFQ